MPKQDPDRPEKDMTPEKELKDRAKRQDEIKKWQEQRHRKGIELDTGNEPSKVPLSPTHGQKGKVKAPEGAFEQIRQAEKRAGKAKKKGK